MLPLQDKDRSVVRVLLKSGCCSRCVLRFCCVGLQVPYRQPSKVHKYTGLKGKAYGCSAIT
uniref:Uncharacterized protein n=1 Tax=Erpetoichthys calabaricus TaxID=27687 RepID=A0A8C4TGZ2_ERPCA